MELLTSFGIALGVLVLLGATWFAFAVVLAMAAGTDVNDDCWGGAAILMILLVVATSITHLIRAKPAADAAKAPVEAVR